MRADDYKKILIRIIDRMAKYPWMFAKDPGRDFTRTRKLSFKKLLYTILCMEGQSIPKELRHQFPRKEDRMCKSAFVQQRNKLLPETLWYLLREYVRESEGFGAYCGYRLLTVDGTALNVARDPDAESYFKGSNINQLQVSTLYDLLGQNYVDVLVQPRPKMNERKAFIEILGRNTFDRKTLIIADRGYDGFAVFEAVNRTPNADYLIRVKDNERKDLKDLPMVDFDIDMEFDVRTRKTNENKKLAKEGKIYLVIAESKHGKEKVNVSWPFPEERCVIKTRVVRFAISKKNGMPVYETVFTSLPRDKFPPDRLKKLYNMRWGVETAFRDLKYAVGLVNLHAKLSDAVLIELYAHILFYNFCRDIAACVYVKQDGTYFYAVNFMLAVDVCRDFLKDNTIRGPDVEAEILEHTEPIRPGREDTRKKAPKSFIAFAYRVS